MNAAPPHGSAPLGGRYRLGALIGRGGMAEVYRAVDERLGREVAVKLFRPGVAEVEDLRRVRSEIRTLAALGHRGLVTLHDASDGDDGGPAYLVLELVRGSDLGALIRRHALSVGQYVSLAGEVAEALTYIHARGIVHRDIKPENVMVFAGEDGGLHAKLADLGIARILGESRLTDTGAVIGTAAYLSPEQVLGREVGTEADVYALGLVLVEALTGEPSFEGGKLEQALARVNRDVEVPDWLDEDDALLLEAMTSRAPEDRPTARETAAALRAWAVREAPWDDEVPDVDSVGPALAPPAGTATPTRILPASAATAVPADRTEVLPRADDPTTVLPVDAALAGADSTPTALLGAPDARTRILGADDPWSGDDPTVVLGRRDGPTEGVHSGPPAGDPAPSKQQARSDSRRRVARRATVAVLIATGVSSLSLAAWPLLEGIAPSARPQAPAYPEVTGSLGSGMGALEASAASSGFTLDAQERIQQGVYAIAENATAGDFDGADAAIEALTGDVDRAAILDRITSSRYADMRARIADVRAGLVTAREEAAEAERLRQEEEARQEQARLEQEQREQEERIREELEQEQQERGGFGQTLDEIGEGIRDQFERWTDGG